MKTTSFLAACLIWQTFAFSHQVTVTVTNLSAERATLSSLRGEKILAVDSIASTGSGRFTFTLDEKSTPGMYRLSFEKGKWIDFVSDGEDVEIVTDAKSPLDSLGVIRSESNRLYYAFRRLNQQYKTRSEILQLVLARYPPDDAYYATTQATVAEVQRSYGDFVESATNTNPTSFVARYIRSAQLPVVDLSQPLERQLAYLKSRALDRVDFTDEGLIRSDLFTGKSIEYLMYYRNPQLPKELLAKEFNGAVDSILNRAKVNQAVYRHITEYLIDGFKQFGFEECINYILENYVIKDDLCLDEGSGSTIQRMIDQKKRLPVGGIAPDILLPDASGKLTSLLTMNAEKILIVFYSISCPHCQTIIPRLSSLAKEKDRDALSVLAVSLDSNVSDWLSFIRANVLTWTNVIDTRGWGGGAAGEYCIYATPTMVLLNREKRVIAKPLTIEDLQRVL
jgi:peroxiredoxin